MACTSWQPRWCSCSARRSGARGCSSPKSRSRTSLAGSTFGVRLLHVREKELVPPALGALFRSRVAVDDRAALFAAPVAIATVAAFHRRGGGEEVADAADLVRDREGLDSASGLIRVDEPASERIELLVGFFHVAPPIGAHPTTAPRGSRERA